MRYFQVETIISLFFIAVLTLGSHRLKSQTPQREEITVIAPYEPTLPEVTKINLQPKIEASETKLPLPEILVTPVNMNVHHNIEHLQEAAPPTEKVNTIYRNHIRAGLGNYLTPYLELNAGSLRNQNYLLNMQFRHLSSLGKIKNYGHSTFGDNMLRLSGRRFYERITLSTELSYDHNVLHHYGFLKAEFPDSVFNTSKDQLRQRFNQAGITFLAQSNNTEPESLHYNGSLSYDFINDVFETSGHRFEFYTHLNTMYKLFRTNDNQHIGLKIGFGNFSSSDSVKTSKNTLIQLQPYLKFKYQEYEIKAGLGLAFDHDSSLHFSIYPMAEGRLQLVENRAGIFVGIDGEKQANSFHNLANQNQFVQSVLEYRSSSMKLRFYGGFQASVGKHLDLTIRGSNTIMGDMPLFVNDTIAPFNRFTVVYDDLNIVQGKFAATFSLSQKLRIVTGFDVFHYTTEHQTKAWHLPSLKTYFDGWYNYSEKLAFRGSLHINGKSWANVWNNNLVKFEEKELDPWVNLSLGATYRYTDQLHFFLDARNLTSDRHFYWYNYPSQRLNIMAGAGFSF